MRVANLQQLFVKVAQRTINYWAYACKAIRHKAEIWA